MSEILVDHIRNINNLITFLEDYLKLIKNVKKSNINNNILLADIAIENIKDRLLEILSESKLTNIQKHISDEIKSFNEIQENLKEVTPLLLYYFINKNNFFTCQEDPSHL